MKRFEKIIIGLMIGSTFPLLLGLLSVVIWFYLDRSEDRAVLYLIIGILSGLIIDYKFLKGACNHAIMQSCNLKIKTLRKVFSLLAIP